MPDKEGSDDEKTTKDVVNKKQKQMMNKEEYISELSPSTLGSYIKKASTSRSALAVSGTLSKKPGTKTPDIAKRKSDTLKSVKRGKMIDLATDKLVKKASKGGRIRGASYDDAQTFSQENYILEMMKKIRKIKKKINPKAVFPPVAQSEIKNKVLTDIDNKNISPNIPSTVNKNPIKKKLQNNLDEEGYDIARDMGRVPKTKDKKDASSYPVSKEVRNMKGDTPMQKEFKKKYGEKATALDAVKQKYKGQIMDVKKEELNLTQVAEAFGGHIVEVRKITKTTDRPYFRKRNVRKFDTDQQDESDFEQRALDDFLKRQNKNTNKKVRVTQNLSYPSDGRRTTGHDTEDFVEPEPEKKKTKKKTKTVADRRLQRIRIAAKKTKKPIVKTAKYLKKNPFATLVGASMAKDQFFPARLPEPPTVKGGRVGRRTAG